MMHFIASPADHDAAKVSETHYQMSADQAVEFAQALLRIAAESKKRESAEPKGHA